MAAFRELGTRFLQMPLGEVEQVELSGPAAFEPPPDAALASPGYPVAMTILEQVQADTREAMKAGERDRVGALRLIASALQQDAKVGDGDEVAVLRRERKKRLEAADAFREGGGEERAAAEEAEAELIETYLPAEISDEELAELVDAAVAEAGASGPEEMGKVMWPGDAAGRRARRRQARERSRPGAPERGSDGTLWHAGS